MVGVADRERVGERVVERDVLAGQVGHRAALLAGDPLVVLAVVPAPRGCRASRAARSWRNCRPEVVGVRVERQDVARAVRLVPDRLAAGQGHRARVAEAAHAAQRAEVVVERAVLLHEHHDVLDVAQVPVRLFAGMFLARAMLDSTLSERTEPTAAPPVRNRNCRRSIA